MPINLEQLRQLAQGKRNAPLVAGVRVSVTSAIRLGGMEVVDPKRFPLVEIRARADACPFCQAMNRKVFRKDAFNAYLPPFHINCRCVVVHLQEGMAQENFDPNEVEPLLKHAHFVADRLTAKQVRYEALQIPARVEGRDFIFRRVKDPTTGRWVSKLEFRPPPKREMPGFFLQGLLPPPGERPVVSLTVIGRTLRQIPAEAWREGMPNVSAIVIPPKDSPIVRELNQRNAVWMRLEGNIIALNTEEVYERLRRLPTGDNGAQAFMATLRVIFPELHRYMTKLPISACIKLVGEVQQYRKALELIEQVHKIPAVKALDVRPAEEELGGMLGGLVLRYSLDAPSNSPDYIVIAMPPPTPLSTIIHEIGHVLDLEAIGVRGQFPSDMSSPVLDDWWRAVRQSRAYQELVQFEEELRRRGLGLISMLISRNVTSRREFFARSYAQYIAYKTQDEALLAEIRRKLRMAVDVAGETREIPWQWEEDDFRPIAEAFDRLFERLGWR